MQKRRRTLKLKQRDFETLQSACYAGALVLIQALDAETREPRAVICAAMGRESNGAMTLMPLAKLFDGNPFDELISST